MNQLFVAILIRQNLISFHLVQFCWQTVGAEGKFHEEASGGDHDKNGRFGKRIYERQTKGKKREI